MPINLNTAEEGREQLSVRTREELDAGAHLASELVDHAAGVRKRKRKLRTGLI
jgi:hypothetical protein